MRIGSLFSGYGGLDAAVRRVLGGELTWVSDIDPGPSKILAHHWPEVPNLGDITRITWTDQHAVDVITGGFPCQDVSHAGRRAGLIRDGEGRTRSGLWGEMLRAIDTLRPRMVVAENVRGLLSARADSDLEPCPFCMGDDGASPMRALGAVLADLADIGYDAAWTGLRAADVGAPHGRFRVFILAWPADGDADAVGAARDARAQRSRTAPRIPAADAGAESAPLTLLPTPEAKLGSSGPDYARQNRPGAGGDSLHEVVGRLLPTPAVNDMGRAYTPDEWDAWTERMKAAHGNGNGHGASLHVEALRMLPTPRAGDGEKGGPNQRGSSGDLMLPSAVQLMPTPSVADVEGGRKTRSGARNDELLLNGLAADQRFGDYAPAIARWEHTLGRPAPAPTEPTGRNGAHRLSPAFVEWMMGLPAGHVTDVPGLSRNAQLKALGNGVVPAQAAAALQWLLQVAHEYGAGAA